MMKIARYILLGIAAISFLACLACVALILWAGLISYVGFAQVEPHWVSSAIGFAICGAFAGFAARLTIHKEAPTILA